MAAVDQVDADDADHRMDRRIVPVGEIARMLFDALRHVEQRQLDVADVRHPARGAQALAEIETDAREMIGDARRLRVADSRDARQRPAGKQAVDEEPRVAGEREAPAQRGELPFARQHVATVRRLERHRDARLPVVRISSFDDKSPRAVAYDDRSMA